MSRRHSNGGASTNIKRNYWDGNPGVYDHQGAADHYTNSLYGGLGGWDGSTQGGATLDVTYNLQVSSAPAGLTFTDSNLSEGFSTAYGFQTAGNAFGFSYPLSNTVACAGTSDWLVQVTFRWYNNCNDPSLACWPESGGRTQPTWGWQTTNTTCISLQNNCSSYRMTNTPGGGTNSSSLTGWTSGQYGTFHMWYCPSNGTTYTGLTDGQDDWNYTGFKRGGNTISRSYTYGTSAPVYFGLGSDYDGAAIGAQSTNFYSWRFREIASGINTNSEGVPAP